LDGADAAFESRARRSRAALGPARKDQSIEEQITGNQQQGRVVQGSKSNPWKKELTDITPLVERA